MDSSNQAKILIVDDNPYNLEVLSRRLERRGFQIICADNGKEALSLIRSQELDLVLLDIMMPSMSGTEVLVEARKTFSKTALPIIMVTSRGESEDVVDSLNLGANDYVMKPIDFPVALARIQTQLSQKREVSKISNTKLTYSLNVGEYFGQYLIEQKVGQGGMGAVYKVHDPTLDRIVALKVILPGHELTKAQVERFNREAKAIAKIKHPNIVTVYQIGETPQHHFTMDFIEGMNLSRLIKERALTVAQAVRLCSKIASALHTAHTKGIIHRDLKPSNIMIDSQNEPHLMDFGLAKMESESKSITLTGDILGTPEYMSPEQVDPHCGEVDTRCDLYSLGVILYEMLCWDPPFTGTPVRVLWQKLNQSPKPPKEHNPDLSPELGEICLKALAKMARERFQNALSMKEQLDGLAV